MEKNMLTEWQRYYALWRESNTMYEEWTKEQGLSMNGYLILYSFYDEEEAPTQKSISRKWMIPKQTVNTILKDFMQKGYVETISMPEDRRNKLLRLTESGKQYADAIIEKLQEKEFYVMQEMGLETIAGMNDKMEQFIKIFRKEGNHEE